MTLPLFLLLACSGDPPVEETPVTWTLSSTDPLPASAPASVLLVNLVGDSVRVTGAVDGDFHVDVDPPDDLEAAFRYRVLTAEGEELTRRSVPGPAQVQAYLGFYSDLAGLDLLEMFPQLGDFPLHVPRLEGGALVALDMRGDDGAWTELTRVPLSVANDPTPAGTEAVVGHDTLWQGGPPESSLDIVILGDGYRQSELARFRNDARALADRLVTAEPLATYAHRLNVHRVDAVSAESGVSYDCADGDCGFRDTAFGSLFAVELVNRLLGADYRTSAVFQIEQWEVARAASVVPWDLAVIIANTSHDGGFAMHYATAPNADDEWVETGVHEFGHLLGWLGDEYNKDLCFVSPALGLPPNIADDLDHLPWAHHVDPDTPLPTPGEDAYDDVIGAFASAFNCDDLYRPARTCRMRSSVYGFCDVCAEQLVRRIFRHVDVIEDIAWSSDGGDLTLTVTGEAPLTATWTLNGAPLGQAGAGEPLTLRAAALSEGELVVEVEHRSPWVLAHGGELAETRRFNLSAD